MSINMKADHHDHVNARKHNHVNERNHSISMRSASKHTHALYIYDSEQRMDSFNCIGEG